jgi:hypothetical protein
MFIYHPMTNHDLIVVNRFVGRTGHDWLACIEVVR